jgi:hypothetical protein
MKRLLLATLLASLLATNAMAWITGKIKRIEVHPTNVVIVGESGGHEYPKQVVSNAEQEKLILTVALTAQTSNATVDMLGEAGKWARIRLTSN